MIWKLHTEDTSKRITTQSISSSVWSDCHPQKLENFQPTKTTPNGRQSLGKSPFTGGLRRGWTRSGVAELWVRATSMSYNRHPSCIIPTRWKTAEVRNIWAKQSKKTLKIAHKKVWYKVSLFYFWKKRLQSFCIG